MDHTHIKCNFPYGRRFTPADIRPMRNEAFCFLWLVYISIPFPRIKFGTVFESQRRTNRSRNHFSFNEWFYQHWFSPYWHSIRRFLTNILMKAWAGQWASIIKTIIFLSTGQWFLATCQRSEDVLTYADRRVCLSGPQSQKSRITEWENLWANLDGRNRNPNRSWEWRHAHTLDGKTVRISMGYSQPITLHYIFRHGMQARILAGRHRQ